MSENIQQPDDLTPVLQYSQGALDFFQPPFVKKSSTEHYSRAPFEGPKMTDTAKFKGAILKEN